MISLASASINYRIVNETVFSVTGNDSNYILGDFGIGTTTPTSRLEVNGNVSLNNTLFVTESGNVGIGTPTPAVPLSIFASTSDVALSLGGLAATGVEISLASSDDWRIISTSISSPFGSSAFKIFNVDTSVGLIIKNTGRVGIGIDAPLALLDVNGNVNLNNTLFVTESGRVGIGTASPSSKLDVQGDFKVNGSAFFVNATSDFVGIRTANPVFPLDVRGIVSISAGSARIELEDILVNNSDWWILPSTGGTTDMFRIYDRGEDADRLIITGSGNVGIGTTNPQAGLHGVVTAGQLLWTDTELNNTAKLGRWGIPGFVNEEEPFSAIVMSSSSVNNIVNIGGGSILGNAATLIRFFTSSTITTTTGTERMIIGSDGNIGIGTSSPVYKLEVNGNVSFNNTLFVTEAGRVGIGTASPSTELDIEGIGIIKIEINSTDSSEVEFDLISGGTFKRFFYRDSDGDFGIFNGSLTQFRIDGSDGHFELLGGNVGIGTQSPTQTLDVAGNIGLTGTVIPDNDCGIPGALITYERGTVVSDQFLALGNGQTPLGAPQACSGVVTAISGMVSGAANVTNHVPIEVYINGVAQTCDTDSIDDLNTAHTTTGCNAAFSSGGIIGCSTKTLTGTVSELVCSIWLRYD